MTDREKNKLVRDFYPLICKIAHQFDIYSAYTFDELMSFSLEGFADAINSYDESKGLTFKQYAGWCCKHSIQNNINSDSLIKISSYTQKKMQDGVTERITTTSIDNSFDGEDIYTDHIIELGVEDSYFDESFVMKQLLNYINNNFDERESDILFSRFGLFGKKQKSCTEIAKEYGISGSRVSAILKGMFSKIRKNKCISDALIEMFKNI